jgi:hypothetical protein
MADHQQIMDLAQQGALAQKQVRYKQLLAEIDSACATVQRAATMMLPGNLDDIKELEISQASRALDRLLPEARSLKAELAKANVYVW